MVIMIDVIVIMNILIMAIVIMIFLLLLRFMIYSVHALILNKEGELLLYCRCLGTSILLSLYKYIMTSLGVLVQFL